MNAPGLSSTANRSRFRITSAVAMTILVVFYLHHLSLESDTGFAIQQTAESLACLTRGQLTGCVAGGSFPLLQKIPAALLLLMKAKAGLVIRLLTILNLMATAFAVTMTFKSLRRTGDAHAHVWLLTVLIGPFLWYAHSSFGEALAASFTLLFLVSLVESPSRGVRGRLMTLGYLTLAGISKDTAPPFLLLLGLAVVAADRRYRKCLFEILGGTLLALLLNVAHAAFRFGTWKNLAYLRPFDFVPDTATQLNFFSALLFAPNGGLWFFWPTAVLIFLMSMVVAIRNRKRLVFVSILGVTLFGLLLGFSRWAYPFGWVCWGPRFLIPWIPAVLYLLLRFDDSSLVGEIKKIFLSRVGSVMSGIFLLLAFYPHAYACFNREIVDWLFLPDSTCPTTPVVQVNRAYYLGCIRHMAWDHPSVLARSFQWDADPTASVLAGLATALIFFYLLKLRNAETIRARL